MERLSGASIEALLSFLSSAAAARDLPAFRAGLAHSLHDLAPSDIVSYNDVDLASGRTTALMDPAGSVPASLFDSFNHWSVEHPLINHFAASGDGEPVRMSDLITTSEFHRLGLYAEFFGRLAIEHQIAFVLPAPAPHVIGLALNRSGRDFDGRERALLGLARPHLAQTYRLAQMLTLFQMGLAAAGQAMVFLHRDDWAFEASDQAAAWLVEFAAEPNGRADRLPEAVQRWVTAQRTRFDVDDAPELSTTLAFRSDDGSRLTIRHLFAGPAGMQDALLLMHQPAQLEPAVLASLGLTKRESELLAAVATGLTNADVARRFSISERTVEKHLSHIYEKLNVTTRTAAVAAAIRAR